MKFKLGDILISSMGFIRYITAYDKVDYYFIYLIPDGKNETYSRDQTFLEMDNEIYTDFFRSEDEQK